MEVSESQSEYSSEYLGFTGDLCISPEPANHAIPAFLPAPGIIAASHGLLTGVRYCPCKPSVLYESAGRQAYKLMDQRAARHPSTELSQKESFGRYQECHMIGLQLNLPSNTGKFELDSYRKVDETSAEPLREHNRITEEIHVMWACCPGAACS